MGTVELLAGAHIEQDRSWTVGIAEARNEVGGGHLGDAGELGADRGFPVIHALGGGIGSMDNTEKGAQQGEDHDGTKEARRHGEGLPRMTGTGNEREGIC